MEAGKRTDAAMLALCALAPACLTASHVGNVADAAHDAGVARVLGLDAQPWRALDVPVGALLAVAPLGTREARAAMGGALVAAAAGMTLYVLARRIAAACADTPRLGALTAAIAALAAVVAPAWQLEAGAVAGSTTGALLVLLPIAALARSDTPASRPQWRSAAFSLGLALGHEPLVGATALVACAVLVGAGPVARRGLSVAWRTDVRALVACALAGLAPWIVAVARTRASGAPLLAALGEAWNGERGASMAGSPAAFVRTELGTVLGALAVGGVVVAMLVPRARPLAGGLLTVAVVGFASSWAGAPVGPTRFGATILAATAASCALAGVAMQSVVRAIAEARLPFARASAAMVLVLELALPVDSADEAWVRSLPRSRGAAAAWDDLAWGALPPRTVVLVTDRRLWARAAAARASGSLRGDVAVVPTFAHGALARRVLARDAALVPLWRDLELSGSPTEASLSSLASERPLAMAYEPRWGRTLGRHLVPIALLDRFEPEPRGASDRRRALDAFAPRRERLARMAARDPELAGSAAYLLRARALDVAASGDRDLVGRVVEDLHAFAPDDPVAAEIVARMVLGKGAPKVDNLRP